MAGFHTTWGYVAIVLCGLAGLWATFTAIRKQPLPRVFWWFTPVAIGAMALQAVVGILLYQRGERPGSQHVFYGFVILFTLAFSYIYRAQLSARPALRWGLMLLFVMGLGIRSVMTYGRSF